MYFYFLIVKGFQKFTKVELSVPSLSSILFSHVHPTYWKPVPDVMSFHPWILKHSQHPLICRILFWHPVFHLGFGFLPGGAACLMRVSKARRRHLSWPLFFPSDLVNGLVALMNSNVSSPVNLVSASSPATPSRVGHRLWRESSRLCFICYQHTSVERVCLLLSEY